MRLSPKELRTITRSFKECLSTLPFKLCLFGSRVDDNKKGGDIDLLVIVEPAAKERVVNLKAKIRNKIFDSLPEQKIDITVATESELQIDPFLSNVFPEAIVLFESSGS
ncbi:MAG: nucleotidyltransferase domain-containing protein [Pseudobdellovibrionaceae bacterium]